MKRTYSVAATIVALGPMLGSPATALADTASDPSSRSERYHETHVLHADGKEVVTIAASSKILKPSAVDEMKQTTLSFSRSAQNLDVLEAYTLKADSRRVPVPKSSWQLRSNTGRAGASPIFSDYNSVTLVYPDLAVGDSVILVYRLTTKMPLFPGKVSLQEHFPKAYAYDDVRVTIDAPVTMPLQYSASGMHEQVVAKGGRKQITWTLQNRTPAAVDRSNWSVFDPDSEPGFAASTFESWSDVARSYVNAAAPKAAVTPRVRQLASNIVQTRTDRTEQARALYDWVSTNVSYAGNCVGIGAVVPRDLDVVLDHKMGDCKDHATLLQALLAARDIPSHQVLVNAGSQFKLGKIPVAASVNHVINYVPELKLFLDSTDGNTAFGRLPVADQDKPVLAAVGDVPSRTPADPGDNKQAMRTTITINDDGSVEGAVRVELGGLYASDARRRLKNLSKEDQAKFVREIFRSANLEADGTFTTDDPQVLSERFAYEAQFKIRNAVRRSTSGALQVTPWFYNEASVMRFAQQAAMRVEDFDAVCLAGASTEEYEITLPPSMQVLSVPHGAAFTSELVKYESSYTLDGRVLRVRRTLEDRTVGNVCTADKQRQYKAQMEPVLDDLRQQLLYKAAGA